MKDFLYAFGFMLLFSVLPVPASRREIKLEYKPIRQRLSYRITQKMTRKAHGEPDKHIQIYAVLLQENVTMTKDGLLRSKESISYLDGRGGVVEKPRDPERAIITPERRDARGQAYFKRQAEQEPLVAGLLGTPTALPIFPADRIKVGDTWIETVAVHTWLHAFDVVVTSKLESVEDHLGFKCAKVSYRFYGHWNARQQSDNRRTAIDLMQFNSEEVIGTGVLYFAYELGTVVEKEQAFKYILDEHTKYWAKEGRIAMRVDNYLECEVKLQMKVQE